MRLFDDHTPLCVAVAAPETGTSWSSCRGAGGLANGPALWSNAVWGGPAAGTSRTGSGPASCKKCTRHQVMCATRSCALSDAALTLCSPASLWCTAGGRCRGRGDAGCVHRHWHPPRSHRASADASKWENTSRYMLGRRGFGQGAFMFMLQS